MQSGTLSYEEYDHLKIRQLMGMPPIGKPLSLVERFFCMSKLVSLKLFSEEQCANLCVSNMCKHDGWSTKIPAGTYILYMIEPLTQSLQWIAFHW